MPLTTPSDVVPSLIRTWTPIGVGAAISWAATQGIDVSDSAKSALVALLTAVISGTYYALVRVAEQKWPQLGWLLGSPNQPSYNQGEPPQEPPAPPAA